MASRTTSFRGRLAVGGWRERRASVSPRPDNRQPTTVDEAVGRVALPPPTANHQPPTAQEGFTLAALIVILTIMAILIAYTVPSQWSLIMRREREKQTIFLMKQFARAIGEWERKHNGLPVSLQQIQDAKEPRMIRGGGKWPLPLTGKEDAWILVPPNAIEAVAGGGATQQGGTGLPGGQRGVGVGRPPGAPPAAGAMSPPGKLNPEASPKDYVGPFIAVRPNAKGPSILSLNGAEDYGEWVYTLQDLKNERMMLQMALSTPR